MPRKPKTERIRENAQKQANKARARAQNLSLMAERRERKGGILAAQRTSIYKTKANAYTRLANLFPKIAESFITVSELEAQLKKLEPNSPEFNDVSASLARAEAKLDIQEAQIHKLSAKKITPVETILYPLIKGIDAGLARYRMRTGKRKRALAKQRMPKTAKKKPGKKAAKKKRLARKKSPSKKRRAIRKVKKKPAGKSRGRVTETAA